MKKESECPFQWSPKNYVYHNEVILMTGRIKKEIAFLKYVCCATQCKFYFSSVDQEKLCSQMLHKHFLFIKMYFSHFVFIILLIHLICITIVNKKERNRYNTLYFVLVLMVIGISVLPSLIIIGP